MVLSLTTLILFGTLILLEESDGKQYLISMNLREHVHIVDEDFLSLTIDASVIEHSWTTVNADMMINMAKALHPVRLRVGGTSEDFILFDPDGKNIGRSNFTMSTSQWDGINRFANEVGWTLIFGLNQLLRTPNGEWDSSNAELLIDYTMKKGYQVAWELGNEPDCYVEDNFTHVSPQQGANGFHILRDLLMKKHYPVQLLAGPDVAVLTRLNYFSEFLLAINDTINATTWHQYYGSSTKTPLKEFYSCDKLDAFLSQNVLLLEIVTNASFTGDLWIGETSSTYGGGEALYSSSFVSGFMWLDKLGIAAYHHKKVFRQEFIGGKYSLLDNDQKPLPDYWLSLLYKQLVGTHVLNVEGALEKGRNVRIYAHCAKYPYPKGSVVLIVLNIFDTEAIVTLTNDELINSDQDIYWLTPSPVTNITSQVVSLNGEPLKLINGVDIPVFKPIVQSSIAEIKLPFRSFGFIVFKKAKATACTT